MEKLNILILGESGVEKSALIKSIRSYMTCNSLKDAQEKSCKNTSEDVHSNAFLMDSCSFVSNNIQICLIDTVGIEKNSNDKWNTDTLKSNLCNLNGINELHGILILLQPNFEQAYLQDFVSMCIKDITMHLGKDACKNISFVLTKTSELQKNRIYLDVKKFILKNFQAIGQDSVFCVEYEHLLFQSKGYQTNLKWRKYSTETRRLIETMLKRDSIKVKQKLNHAEENEDQIKELNILLLGETGVGKSTWINGFVNYLKFKTLNDAINGDPVYFIPAEYVVYDSISGKEKAISVGKMDETTENCSIGNSGTQKPKSYTILTENRKVCLIDTPGIGDTRGRKQDEINFEYIMCHISHLKELHGICIFLKPNESRLSENFNFCFQGLMKQLHKDACKNIIFVFTHARATYYEGGDTLPLLNTLLKNNSLETELSLSEKNLYCVDNEAIRYLAIKSKGVEIKKRMLEGIFTSWEQSVGESERLIKYISSLEPHSTVNTVSLNMVRRLVIFLSKQLAKIADNIQINIETLAEKNLELQELMKFDQGLTKVTTTVNKVNLKTKHISQPNIICINPNCSLNVLTDKSPGSRVCKEKCSLKGLYRYYNVANIIRISDIFKNGICSVCQCTCECHELVTYEYVRTIEEVIDVEAEEKIKMCKVKSIAIKQFMQKVEQKIADLEKEQSKLIMTGAKGECFLEDNSTLIEKDVTECCLKELVNLQKKSSKHCEANPTLCAMEKMLSQYTVEKKRIKDLNIATTPSEMYQYILALYEMPLNGKTVKDILESVEMQDCQTAKENEVMYIITPTLQGWGTDLLNWFKR